MKKWKSEMPRTHATEVTPEMIEWAVHTSMHTYVSSDERWEQARKTGLADEELLDMVRCELGISGGRSTPWYEYMAEYKGGQDPAIWLKKYRDMERYGEMKGKKLLAMVRRVMEVGVPAFGGVLFQEKLF